MFKPGLNAAQRDAVVACLDGGSLVELARACIESADMEGLHALVRGRAFSDLLKNPLPKANHLKHPMMSGELSPILDVFAQVFSHQRPVEIDPRQAAGSKDAHRTELAIPQPLRDFIADQIDRCLMQIERKFSAENTVLPGRGWSEDQLRTRPTLVALAALSVAVDDESLVGRIMEISRDVLFARFHMPELSARHISGTKEPLLISPWGLAFSFKRLDLLKSHFNPSDIHLTLAVGNGRNFHAEDLLSPEGAGSGPLPLDADTAIWTIQCMMNAEHTSRTRLNKEDAEHTPPGERIAREICMNEQPTWGWGWMAQEVFDKAPELFSHNLQHSIEACCTSDSHETLARILSHCVDWRQWDGTMGAKRKADELVFVPSGHPLGTIWDTLSRDNTSNLDGAVLDAPILICLRAMHHSKRLDILMSNDLVIGSAPQTPAAFDIAGKGMTRSLEFLLQAGLNPRLLARNGSNLLDFCERLHGDGPAAPMLRAALAQREATQAIDGVLASDLSERRLPDRVRP